MTKSRQRGSEGGRVAKGHYSVGIGPWNQMTSELLLAVLDRCDGDLARAAEAVDMSEAAMLRAFVDARGADLPKFYAVCVKAKPDSWKLMLARMLLAVVDEASSLASAAAVLGLRRSALRGRVRRARWLMRGQASGCGGDPQ